MKKSVFTGAGVAIVTPMKNNKVDFDAMEKLIEFQIENLTDAIVVCGTTGEAPTLEDDEHLDVIEFCVEKVNKRIPVIAGTGSNNTAHAIMMNIEAEKRGADGLLWVSPYYNKATQKGLVEHYTELAKSTSLPAILYNVPSRTGVNILPETIEKLAEIENIVAVKEASGKVEQAVEIINRCGDKIDVYSGNDDITVPIMSVGGKGVISVLSNVLPKETHLMCEYALKGDFIKAGELQVKYYNLVKALFKEVNPIPVKAALNLMGIIEKDIRLPLSPMEGENLEYLKTQMKIAGIL